MKKNPDQAQPRCVYLDTSAYLCILLGEEGNRKVRGAADRRCPVGFERSDGS